MRASGQRVSGYHLLAEKPVLYGLSCINWLKSINGVLWRYAHVEWGFLLKVECVCVVISSGLRLLPQLHESAHVGAAKAAIGGKAFAALAAPTLLQNGFSSRLVGAPCPPNTCEYTVSGVARPGGHGVPTLHTA